MLHNLTLFSSLYLLNNTCNISLSLSLTQTFLLCRSSLLSFSKGQSFGWEERKVSSRSSAGVLIGDTVFTEINNKHKSSQMLVFEERGNRSSWRKPFDVE